jgi:hypothetical protein
MGFNNFIDERTGKKFKDISEKDIVMTGEVESKVVSTTRMLKEPKDDWKDVDYTFEIKIRKVDEIKAEYGKVADQVKAMSNAREFMKESLESRKFRNETLEITFYHRRTKFMPEGAKIVFTNDVLLEKGPIPVDHKRLPYRRLTDIDVEDHLHGLSYFINLADMQFRHNQLTSDIVKNLRLAAHPKWMVPRGACKIEQLADNTTIVQFKGNREPTLATFNPVSQEVFLFRRELKDEMDQMGTTTGVARRDPPSQVGAAVAMSFLSEQEAERISTETSKVNELTRGVYEDMMSVAGTYYQADDGRTMRVIGEGNKYFIKNIETANLSKPYDVVIRNTNLPQLKTAKFALMMEVLEKRPDMISNEQLADIIDLGGFEKFADITTEALRSAESENEDIMRGEEVAEPTLFEEMITHWKVHIQFMQSRGYKESANPEYKAALEEHVAMTEFLMLEKMKSNPLLESEIAKLMLFPAFLIGDQIPNSKEHKEAMVQGQSNRGEQVTDVIPATPEELEE